MNSNTEKKEKKYDLCTIGDAQVDFIPTSDYTPLSPIYLCKAGGTMANVASSASKLGMKVLSVGNVGDDCMGNIVLCEMERYNVDISAMVKDEDHFTTQCFVSLSELGERSFSFSRNYGADAFLEKSELDMNKILDSKMIYVSGVCFSKNPLRDTTIYIAQEAVKHGIPVVCDVNYRDLLWESEHEFAETMMKVLPLISLLKASDDEAIILTGEKSMDRIAKKISAHGCKLVALTSGSYGSQYLYEGRTAHIPSYKVNVVDTTGSGDTFFGGLLSQIAAIGFENIKHENLTNMFRYANAAGSLCATKRGAIAGVPTHDEIIHCVNTMPHNEFEYDKDFFILPELN